MLPHRDSADLKGFFMKRRISAALCIIFFCLAPLQNALSQKPADVNLDKLDGRFRQLVKKANKDWHIPKVAPSPDKKLKKIKDGKTVYGAIIYTKDVKTLHNAQIKVQSEEQTFATALVDENDLIKLARMQEVLWVDAGDLDSLHNDIARIASGVELVNDGFINNTEYKGQDVLVCIVDTGIDWEHLDFRDPADPTQSRIRFIWDQTLTPQGGESNPIGFTYGVEYNQSHINDELDGSPRGFVRSQDTHGHGTHVAGTAAGNGAASVDGSKFAGMTPEADILVVKAGNGTFPNTNVIDALAWAESKADELGLPLVVNLSLGGNYGPHDGTDAKSLAIDTFCKEGRAVVASAGNDGYSEIHVSDYLPGSQFDDFILTIPSYLPATGQSNDLVTLEIWFDSDLDISATVTSPNGYFYTGGPGTQNGVLTNDGTIYISNLINTNNGDRYIEITLFDYDATYPPLNGNWTIRLTNQTTSTPTTYHGWFEDPQIGDPVSVATLAEGNEFYSLGNTAAEAVIVGSYATRWYWQNSSGSTYFSGFPDGSDDISGFSSYGPTRLGTDDKPDIAAPGQLICSSRSNSTSPSTTYLIQNEQHVLNQGTSMAAPVVTGCVALLMQADPTITPTTLLDVIRQNAYQDSYTGPVWGEQWGVGKLDLFASLAELTSPTKSMDKHTLVYDQWGSQYHEEPVHSGEKAALQFIPTSCGQLKKAWLHIGRDMTITGLNISLYNDNAGMPGNSIGTQVSIPPNSLLPFSWNPIDLSASQVSVKKDSIYYIAVEPVGTTVDLATDKIIDDNLSRKHDGSSWSAIAGDLRIRPVIARNGIVLVAKLFLQGAYDLANSTINTNINGDLPLTSPYSENPRTIGVMPAGVVDWVLIQLTDPATNSVVASHSALLHSSGRIVADDGATGVVFIDALPDDYRILLKHRNHVVIASASTPTMNGSNDTLFDFTDSANLYAQNGAVELQTNIWGLWCGDSDGSELVNSTDYTVWYNAVRASASGYEAADINLDGLVDQTDYTLWQNSASAGAQAVLP